MGLQVEMVNGRAYVKLPEQEWEWAICASMKKVMEYTTGKDFCEKNKRKRARPTNAGGSSPSYIRGSAPISKETRANLSDRCGGAKASSMAKNASVDVSNISEA